MSHPIKEDTCSFSSDIWEHEKAARPEQGCAPEDVLQNIFSQITEEAFGHATITA